MTTPHPSETDVPSADHSEYPHQETLASLALSSRVVFRELEVAEEPLTLRELARRLRTPDRTIRKGMRRLLDAGLAERHVIPELPGSSCYTLADEAEAQR